MLSSTHQSPWIDNELRIFRESVRNFIQKEFVPFQARWYEQHHPDADAWTKAGEMGMLLSDVPRTYGGGDGTIAYTAVVLEELAQTGVNFGIREQNIVAHYILNYGSEEQKRKWLPLMALGKLVGAIAMTEPSAGSDLQGIKTTARRDGDQYVINGSKTFITNGLLAGIICLAAKTDAKAASANSISLIMIESKNLAGYSIGKPLEKVGLHGQDNCELFFEDVRVPVSNLLGTAEGGGFFQMMEQLPYERLQIGVHAAAMTERALAITTRYVKERKAFGKPLIDLQNTRFQIAECKTEAHIGRIFIDSCIQRFMDHQFDSVTAAMAKYWLTDVQNRVIDKCVQLHGGYGYMMEYPIARMWTDCRMQRIGGGTNEIMKEIIGWSI
jgi:acyl-CoA dehydrogenase